MAVRVGVVGVGVMGADHARKIATVVSGAELVAVSDFDATVAELKAKGVPLQPEETFGDGTVRICYFADPAGNRGQVVYRAQQLGV